MIAAEKLCKWYGTKAALVDMDLSVAPGEILGFLGPNGAGKSTMVKILAGLLPADSGRAIVAGYDIAAQPLEAKARLGYVPETPALYEALTADEFLDVIASLHHLDATARTRRADLLDLFELSAARHLRLKDYSKGMRQKIVIAAALLHRPEVLILDEPFDGIDANSALVMKDLLKRLAAQGKTILFSSHILEVVERVCTRISIIDAGRKVIEGTVADICNAAGVGSLDLAFAHFTGVRDAGAVASQFLQALERP